jgi:NAD(P)-dependent dehydrogenase (short-subunit alcohol dehydrogenase family)
MTGKLAGKVAVVTGGSAGIGLGIAEHFSADGARVFITGRRQSELDKAVTAIGGNAAAIQGDTSNLADLDRIYATIKAQSGHIDVLAANAGVYEFAALGEITEEHFDRTFNTNVRGLLFAVQKALPLLTKGSSVILTGSMVSIKGFPACSVYNASKAAIRSFARGWIVDLKGRDIRVNVLSPGYTATPGVSHFMTDERQPRPLHPFRSAGSAHRTTSARRRCSSLPTTAPTSTGSSCSWTAERLKSEHTARTSSDQRRRSGSMLEGNSDQVGPAASSSLRAQGREIASSPPAPRKDTAPT